MRNMAFRGVVAFLAGGLYAGFLFVPGFAAGADAPQGTDKSFPSIREETQTVDVADWGFRDPADTPPNTFVAVTLTSLPAAGEVRVDGVPATNG